MKKKHLVDTISQTPHVRTMTPDDVVDVAVNEWGRKEFYGLCSGGKDSVSVCHWFSTNYPE